MSETPLPNSDEARTAEGTLKDASLQTESKTEDVIKTEPAVEAKVEGETLLTDKKAEPEPAKVPDKYEFKPPEDWAKNGWELDGAIIESATPIFKKLGLSNEAAQELVSFYATQSQKDHEASLNLVKEQNEKWVAEVKADPEIGGKLDQVKTTISKAIDGLGDPKLAAGFREAMDMTGAGNNPAFIRAFYKLAQKVTEGTAVTGNGPSKFGQSSPAGAPASVASAMYPNLK